MTLMHGRKASHWLLLALLAWIAPAAGQGVHHHGTAQFEVVIEGNTVSATLRSPLESLVGFEHAPRTSRQKAALERMERVLREPGQWIKPSAPAVCSAGDVDVTVSFGRPGQGHEDHAEAEVHWRAQCARAGELREIEVALFESFPRLERIRAQAAGPRGQRSATLTPKRRTLRLQ
jgi:hypothetical protein